VINALTIDVEDWYHVCGLDEGPPVPFGDRRVAGNVDSLLALLKEHGVTATFFILGSVAEEDPALVPRIAAAGHEIASHGYSHRLVTELTPDQFREEVRRTGDILAAQCGVRPTGYRAPQWSLSTGATPWAPAILREEGYRYDSSCNPLPFIGERDGQRTPFLIGTPAGTLLEVPPMVTPTLLGNLPTGGGWGFRFFPQSLIGRTVARLNRAGFPAVIYLHPREMDAHGPRLRLSPIRAFAVYGPRRDAVTRLRYLLRRFRFGTVRQLVENWEPV
jgi:polysaccharide deacetylase family protein (PEP-CTERM system associated)